MKKSLKIGALLMTAMLSVAALGGCAPKAEVASLPQFEREIAEGEEIAVITVKDYGEIKVRFFEDKAPKAVQNFKALAKSGYYDELTFHRVEKNFMIQGGDPKGNSTGGKSSFENGAKFEDEINHDLCNFRGALAMANSGPDSNTSQFYIVQNSNPYTDDQRAAIEESRKADAEERGRDYVKLADKVWEKYKEIGGLPSLDGGYTVFGQVYEGMEVVDKISECKVKAASSDSTVANKPVEEVLIQKVEILPYKK